MNGQPSDMVTEESQGARLARRYFELIDEGRLLESVDLFAGGAVYSRPGHELFVGRDAIARFYTGVRPIREGRHRLTTVLDSGSEVAVAGEFHGVLHDDRSIHLRFADFFQLDSDGRFRRRDTYFFTQLV